MALQLLRTPSLNQLYSDTFGTGLQNLAQSKLQQLQSSNQMRALQAISSPNIDPEMRSQLAGFLSPDMQKEYFKQELKRPGEEAYARAMFGEEHEMEPGQPRPRLTEKQATELAKQQRSQSKFEYEKAKPFIKDLQANAPLAKIAFDATTDLLEAIDSGKVNFGFIGSKVPTALQNEETQKFINSAQRLLDVDIQNTKGRPTEYLAKIKREKKPSLEYTDKVNRKIIEGIRQDALDKLNLEKAYDDVLTKYGSKTPANLEQLIKSEAKNLGKKEQTKLPPISEYEEGDVIRDKNGQYHMVSSGQWIDIDESQI